MQDISRYSFERIKGRRGQRDHFRVSNLTDDRVATCHLKSNARLVTDALNKVELLEGETISMLMYVCVRCRRISCAAGRCINCDMLMGEKVISIPLALLKKLVEEG